MPVTRPKKPTAAAGSKIPKPAKVGSENQVRAARLLRTPARPSSCLSSGQRDNDACCCLVMCCVVLCVLQEEGPQVKRSSSPPHGAPKKRTAFIDITNVSQDANDAIIWQGYSWLEELHAGFHPSVLQGAGARLLMRWTCTRLHLSGFFESSRGPKH